MSKNLIVFLLCTLCCISCIESPVFDEYHSVEQKGWYSKDAKTFNLKKLDTTSSYNLFINIRNNNEYDFSNLFMITKITFPNGKTEIDTLEYLMADSKGNWLGQGAISIKESKLWFKKKYSFNEEGDYQVSISHAMRRNGSVEGIEHLKGITNVGLSVEKIQH